MMPIPIYKAVFILTIILVSSCASLPDNSQSDLQLALPSSNTVSPAKALFLPGITPVQGKSGFLMLGDGLDAFVARMAMVEHAERSIDVKTFIFSDDIIGRSVLYALLQAADRGVRVRLLLDDLWLGSRDAQFYAFSAHPNIEIRMFNPLKRTGLKKAQYVTRFGSVTRRMHNKAFIVDNQIAVVGGRNIAQEYFEADSSVAFGDIDVLTVGPVIAPLSESFDKFWNHQLAYSIESLTKKPPTEQQVETIRQDVKNYLDQQVESAYVDALYNSKLVKAVERQELEYFWGNARVIGDSPDKLITKRDDTSTHMAAEMGKLFEAANQEVIIFSPYFIPTKDGASSLIELVQKGVSVRILTNSIASNNHAAAHAHYAKYRKRLLAGGVEIYEVKVDAPEGHEGEGKTQVLHAKMFVFDRTHTFVGSLNMDPRSWIENTEIGVVLDSDKFGQGVAEWFDQGVGKLAYKVVLREGEDGEIALAWLDSDGTVLEKEPNATYWKRVKDKMYRILPVESQL